MMNKVLIKRITIFSLILILSAVAPFRQTFTVKGANVGEEQQTNAQLNTKSKALVKNTSFHLKIYNLSDNQKASFKSASANVASVDKEGVVTAKKIGSTTINVLIKEGFKTVDTLQCDINVGPPAISIKLTRSEITMAVDKKVILKTILKPNNTVEEPRFTSSDPLIAVVNSSGKITAKAPGEALISASVGDNLTDYCIITVVEEELSSELSLELE